MWNYGGEEVEELGMGIVQQDMERNRTAGSMEGRGNCTCNCTRSEEGKRREGEGI